MGIKWMGLAALTIGIAASACGNGGSTKPIDAAPDATIGPDAPPPYGFQVERIDMSTPNHRGDSIESLSLNEDGSKLAYCVFGGPYGGKVGFIDTESFTVLKETDLQPLSTALPNTASCRLTTIGDYAYVFYAPNNFNDNAEAIVVKMSFADNTVKAVWPVPDAYFIDSGISNEVLGVQATNDPNRALLMTHRNRSNPGLSDGISAIFLDLSTGEFTEELLVEQGAVIFIKTFALIGNKLFGLIHITGEPTSTQFLVDIDNKELVWSKHLQTPVTLSVNRDTDQILIADVPSGGWSIFDALSGDLVRGYEYITGGFTPYAVWMRGGRIVHITSGSSGNGTMTIVNESDGSFVANLVIPFGLGFGPSGLVVSDDGKDIYLGGSGAIVKVTVPDSL